jgi:hypothetical protein
MKEVNYYAVIPAEVRYSKMSANAKLLYGEISALANKEGYCWASNKYFADLYEVTETSVSLWIKQLRDKGFIECEIKDNFERKIFLKGVLKKVNGGIKKIKGGVLKKVKHNNTSNIKLNNTYNTSEQSSQVSEVIKYFEKLDAKNKLAYGNKTQRKACEVLLKEYGIEKTQNAIDFYLLVRDKNYDYLPKITSPYELLEKWTSLQSFVQREIKKDISNNVVF